MLFWKLFRKYTRSFDKKEILKGMIVGLSIDQTQKNLFLESLEFLSDEALELLYQKITRFVDILEEESLFQSRKKTETVYSEVEKLENIEKKNTQNSFNLLLDSI